MLCLTEYSIKAADDVAADIFTAVKDDLPKNQRTTKKLFIQDFLSPEKNSYRFTIDRPAGKSTIGSLFS